MLGRVNPELIALLAKRSAVSLPRIPTWAGTQTIVISRCEDSAILNLSLMAKMRQLPC